MVADLVTQQSTLDRTELDAIMQIGGAILQPYNRTQPKIVVTAIRLSNDATPQVTVAWSRKLVNGVASVDAPIGAVTTVPPRLRMPGTFLVRVTSELDYRPVITWTAEQKASLGVVSAFDNIAMSETYYLRPRVTSEITCSNC